MYVITKVVDLDKNELPRHIRPHLDQFEEATTVILGMLLVFFLLVMLCRKFFSYGARIEVISPQRKYIILLFILTSIIFSYKVFSGRFYGLGYEGNRSLIDIIIFNLASLGYLGFYLVLLNRRRLRYGWALTVGYIVLFTVDLLISTSKAPLIVILLTYIWAQIRLGKKVDRRIVLSVLILVPFAVIYSYYTRYYFDVYTQGADVFGVFESLLSNDDLNLDKILLIPLLTRLEHLHNFTVVYTRMEYVDMGMYAFGSVVELLNFIPRVIWLDRPFLSFNYFVTSEVYQSNGHWSSSIGRFGEVFLVFGWLAPIVLLLGFLIYECLASIIRLLYKGLRGYLECYYYLFILYFVWHDDYFLQSAVSFVIVVFVSFILYIFVNEKKNYSL